MKDSAVWGAMMATVADDVPTPVLLRQIGRAMRLTPSAAINTTVGAVVEVVGRHLAVDRVCVYAFHDRGLMSITHEWCGDDVGPVIKMAQGVPSTEISAWLPALTSGAAVRIDDAGELPDGRGAEGRLMTRMGIRSLLAVPMLAVGELVGFVAVHAVHRHQRFDSPEADALQHVADSLCSAMQAQRGAAAARRATSQLEALTRHGSDLLLVVDRSGAIRLQTASGARTLGTEIAGRHWRTLVHPEDQAVLRAAGDQLEGRATSAPTGDFRLRDKGGRWLWF